MAFITDIINNNNHVNIYFGRVSIYTIYIGPKYIVHVYLLDLNVCMSGNKKKKKRKITIFMVLRMVVFVKIPPSVGWFARQ